MARESKHVVKKPKGGRARQIREEDPGNERDEYAFFIAMEQGCKLSHTYPSHLTYTNANGTTDQAASSNPIPPVNANTHPPIGFRYRGVITNPINASTPHMNDCVMIAFYDTPRGTGRWDGRIQVICRKVWEAPTSVWLELNSVRAPNNNQLEARPDAPARCLFTRMLDTFRIVHANYADYKERLYMSVSGCRVTIIGEASMRAADGSTVRTTKIHLIDCCQPSEDVM
ncbi:MAG: hypothetical protein A3G80_06290 [Betaproteobacteria bacterium RIFCSPLOWO2_12_FULL_62_13b]|nr:MAG: hypothetical protein A3G80_06290 [Betaproteobacteria bacterium RIFCSPLOWO2_12_FULL_62_13b]